MGDSRPQMDRDRETHEMERRLEDARQERDRLRRELEVKAALAEYRRHLQKEFATLDVRLEQARAGTDHKRED